MRHSIGCIALVAGLVSAAAAQQYTVIDAGILGGYASFGLGVNAAGHAVGGATPYNNANFHGLFFAETPQLLEPLPGDTQCWAMAVNSADTVVAMSFTLGALVPHGILWQNGTTTSLGDLTPRALNNIGTVVGYRTVPDATYGIVDRPAIWSNGVMTELPNLGGSSGYAAGINDQGQVVGWSFTTRDLQVRAVLWQGGVIRDLGTLGGLRSQAYAINNANEAVGFGQTLSGAMHAMRVTLSPGGTVVARTDLGTLDGTGTSIAYAINTSSDIVGTSNSRAVLWTGASLVDLNLRIGTETGWFLRQAWSISDAGHIAGSGVYYGQPHAFVLVPGCYANCDGSTGSPRLSPNDFVCFLNRYVAGDPYANCDGFGGLTANDFTCFVNSFAAGCT